MKENRYTMPQQFMDDPNVSLKWKLYGYLNGFWIGGKSVYARNDTIAKEFGKTERAVQSALEELEKMGLISRDIKGLSRYILPGGLKYEGRSPASPLHEAQLHPRDEAQLHHTSDRGIAEINLGVPEDGKRVVFEEPTFRGEGYEEEARTKGAPKNTKEMLAGYEIFDDQPARKTWKLREIERESMKILLEEYGHEKLVKRYAAVKAHRHDQFCPLIKSPSTFLQLMPNLERFIKNLEQ